MAKRVNELQIIPASKRQLAIVDFFNPPTGDDTGIGCNQPDYESEESSDDEEVHLKDHESEDESPHETESDPDLASEDEQIVDLMKQPEEFATAVNSGNVSRVVQIKRERNLTDNEKYNFLKNHFVPDEKFLFPSRAFGKEKRHFQKSWLDKYTGLVYCKVEDGGYCKQCLIFAKCDDSFNKLGILVTRPLVNFKKATYILQQHFLSQRKSHVEAVEKSIAFCGVMENKIISIDRHLSSQRAEIVAKNRLKLRAIAATVLFCGRQAIALRGHRDDGSIDIDDASLGYGKQSNFRALLMFRIDAGDEILKEHFQTTSHNAMYISKDIQNQIISIAGDIIRMKILQKVRNAHWYSVIADEATDAANDEQLSVSIRFVDDDGSPNEKFIGFIECLTGVTGDAIANNILKQLTDWQLNPNLLRGQAYDGAGSMAGKTKGTAARIMSLYPKAVFTIVQLIA